MSSVLEYWSRQIGKARLADLPGTRCALERDKLSRTKRAGSTVHERGLIRIDPPAHGSILQVSSYVVLAELLQVLRSQQKWGHRLLAALKDDSQPAQHQRELLLVEHIRGRGIPERDWHQLGAHGISKKICSAR